MQKGNSKVRTGGALIGAIGVAMAAAQAPAEETGMKEIDLDVTGARLRVYQAGADSADALVFVHGDSGRASQWFAVMARLADDYRVIGYDQRGHGASSPGAGGDYDYPARARDLASVIEAGGLSEVVLVAHSAGAGVALQYAAEHGDSVRAVYLLDPATDPRAMPQEMRQGFLGALASPEALEAVQGYYASIAGGDGAVIATVQADAAGVTAEARLGVATALLDWDPETVLAGWDGPLHMLVTPANDNPASIRHLRANVSYELAETEGHWPQLSTPDMVAASIRSFLTGLD